MIRDDWHGGFLSGGWATCSTALQQDLGSRHLLVHIPHSLTPNAAPLYSPIRHVVEPEVGEVVDDYSAHFQASKRAFHCVVGRCEHAAVAAAGLGDRAGNGFPVALGAGGGGPLGGVVTERGVAAQAPRRREPLRRSTGIPSHEGQNPNRRLHAQLPPADRRSSER